MAKRVGRDGAELRLHPHRVPSRRAARAPPRPSREPAPPPAGGGARSTSGRRNTSACTCPGAAQARARPVSPPLLHHRTRDGLPVREVTGDTNRSPLSGGGPAGRRSSSGHRALMTTMTTVSSPITMSRPIHVQSASSVATTEIDNSATNTTNAANVVANDRARCAYSITGALTASRPSTQIVAIKPRNACGCGDAPGRTRTR